MNRARGTLLKSVTIGSLWVLLLSSLLSCGSRPGTSATPGPQALAETPDSADAQGGKKAKSGSFTCTESNDEKCFTEKYHEPSVETQAVDILFVIQTSPSLAQELSSIADGIKSFIGSLPGASSYNIGVMLAHGSTSVHSGKLYQVHGEAAVLKSSELTTAQIQKDLNSKLTQIVEDPDSGGGEEGLYSLYRGVTNTELLAQSQAAGFFRPEAALAVVFVADHRDICATPGNGVPVETDPVKVAARIRDCEGLTAQGLSSRLKFLKGTQPLAISGILYEHPVPSEDGNEIGYGYLDMINLNAGVTIDIADDEIAAGLSSIAQLSSQQMSQKKVFTLSHTEVDETTLKVTINGVPARFQWNGADLTVTDKIQPGDSVVISYCVKSVEESECTHKHGKGGGHHCDKARHPHGDETDKNGDGHPDQGKSPKP